MSMSKKLSGRAISKCLEVLPRCDQFKNGSSLRCVFNLEALNVYKDGLPEYEDTRQRILGTIDYLQEKSSDDVSVLTIFLEGLKYFNEGDPVLCQELDICIRYVTGGGSIEPMNQHQFAEDRLPEDDYAISNTPIRIPFVIAAMTQEEARELISGTAFDARNTYISDREEFEEIKKILKTYEIENLEIRYGERREDWKPYLKSEESIRGIIDEACKKINSMKKFDQVEPEFISSKYFESLEVRNQLKSSGAVLIMDDLSFFHPTLRKNLNKIISNDRAAIVILSTLSGRSRDQQFYDKIDSAIKTRLDYAHERYCTNLDPKCEICVDDLLSFKRWLSKVLPEEAIFIRDKQPHPGSQKAFQAMYAEAYPTATASLITGRAVRSGIGR